MRPAPEAVLAGGRYRLQRRLGAGGMASVWLATDERLERPVAVKIVADTLADDEHWVRRFRREAQAAAALAHRGVVPVFDYGVEDGRPFLVMEYIGGGTLADRLAAASGVPDPATVARELLEALAAVHDAGILHRDVKPANLLFDDHGHVRLTDFGIAQPQDSSSLTRTGMVLGTLRYLAPEVAAGEPATVQSDLYSAGVVIGELARVRGSAAVGRLAAALTEPDPADRPASAADALRLLGGEGAGTVARASAAPDGVPATAVTRQATAATRPVAAATAATASRLTAATARLAETTRLPARAVYALLALVAVVIIVVVVASSGGSSPSAARRVPSPAPAQAPVAQQVQALDRIVQSARR